MGGGEVTILAKHAEARAALHAGHASSRPLSDDYERVGLAGEFAFGRFCGQMPDLFERPAGDKGVDFVLPLLYAVDVKTARKANNLIHEASKPLASDIYVLAEYGEDDEATLVGWAWRRQLAEAPVKDFGHGIKNRYIPRASLRAMEELGQRIWRVR
jgi:hypothetical protein